jgi:hypothetical protein
MGFAEQARLELTPWTYVLEVLALNLGRDTGFLDYDFSWFSSVPPGKCRDITSIKSRRLLSKNSS